MIVAEIKRSKILAALVFGMSYAASDYRDAEYYAFGVALWSWVFWVGFSCRLEDFFSARRLAVYFCHRFRAKMVHFLFFLLVTYGGIVGLDYIRLDNAENIDLLTWYWDGILVLGPNNVILGFCMCFGLRGPRKALSDLMNRRDSDYY